MKEAVLSREGFKLLAVETVENLTQTLKQYTTPIQNEVNPAVILLRQQATIAFHQSRTHIETRPWLFLATLAISYLTLVQVLRFRNLRNINKKYAAYLDNPYKLNYKTAHPIMKQVMLSEAPFMFAFSTQMALVKTYAVAPGTGLLVATRQLTTESNVGKRAEDTGVILSEFTVGDIDGERGTRALSKMNWLHRKYGNKIRRPEMLHTLAMFVLEPIRWYEMYEWRPMTKLEQVAIYTYWKEIGSRMGMDNLPETLEDLEKWTDEYSKENMYYTDNNKACAEATLGLFIRDLPPFMRSFAKQAAISLFEDHVRESIGYEKPPQWIANLVNAFLKTRGFVIRHFFLPRFSQLDPLPKQDKDGKYHRERWAFEPWYVKDTLVEKIKSWISTRGKVVPGAKYKSEGFLVEELGPIGYEKTSRESVLKEAEQMKEYAAGGGAVGQGCPFRMR